MRPFVMEKAGDAPEHAKGFDGAGGLHFSHVRGVPAELIKNLGDGFLAGSSLPQMNMVGRPASNLGFTNRSLPTELNALTKWATGNSRCSSSIEDSLGLVKY